MSTVLQNYYTKFVSSVLFPLHERLKGHTSVAVRKELETTQWWPTERLRELQIRLVRQLLGRAEQEVPYYRRLFAEHGFFAGQVQDLDDLKRLPFLTKALIRENSDNLRSIQASGLMRFNTGGSSGEPLVFYIGKERVSHDVAAKWRATRWWGVDIGDPEIVVWGSPIELGTQDRVREFRDKAFRTRLLPAFEMNDARVSEFLRDIRHLRPRMLFGYPSALSHIAGHAHAHGVAMDDLGIKVAFVTSEVLYEHQRAVIESVFGCRVANGYGGRDAGFIAHECPEGGMHITAEDIIVEIVDEDGKCLPSGQSGEVVVTHLATADYPFIRYRTGDVAALDDRPCPCGRGLPMLKEIHGRTTDFLVATDGTVMHGLALIYIVRDLQGVQKFKIVQEDLHHTRVLIVTDANFRSSDLDTIRNGVRQRLGVDVEVSVELVNEISAELSGKFRYVVSKVAIGSDSVPRSS